jgi:predicted dehydrogenase
LVARVHARALAQIPDARLVAVTSRRLQSAEALVNETGSSCAVYAELDPLLSRPDVDVVIVATPSGAHMEPALAAAAAHKHVIVEKPLEITLERCDRVIETCRRNGVLLGTVFPARFLDANRVLKTALEEGRFGRLTLGETTCKWWRPQAYYDEGRWKGTRALDGGGALMNQAIHSVDLLTWLMGPVAQVSAFTATLAHERLEVEDTAVASLRFANGALGMIEAATSSYPGTRRTIAIHGDRGTAIVEEDQVQRWEFSPAVEGDGQVGEHCAARKNTASGASNPADISPEGHRRQFADFMDAIRLARQPAVDGSEGRKAVELVLGIYRSAATGHVVTL